VEKARIVFWSLYIYNLKILKRCFSLIEAPPNNKSSHPKLDGTTSIQLSSIQLSHPIPDIKVTNNAKYQACLAAVPGCGINMVQQKKENPSRKITTRYETENTLGLGSLE